MANEAQDERILLRNALGSFATGVTVVTTSDEGDDVGMTANSFNSVSLDPPMVLWSLAKTAASLPVYQKAEHFAVHILAADQQDISQRFATKGADKFEGIDVARGVGNVPILSGCAAVFHCKTAYRYEGGDHEIMVGEVLKYEHFDKPPLVFHSGKYALAVEKQQTKANDNAENELNNNSLTYLMGLVYFQLARKAEQEMLKIGVSQLDIAVLNVLAMSDGSTVDEIDKIVSLSGLRVTDEVLSSLVKRKLITLETVNGKNKASLQSAGQELLVKWIAYIKAVEEDAMPDGAYAEIALAKNLLRNTARNLLQQTV